MPSSADKGASCAVDGRRKRPQQARGTESSEGRHWFKVGLVFERVSTTATTWTGSSGAFMLAFVGILIWLISGPFFGFSDTWQLVINTGTTIITFLMVFLIQHAQNKESLAVQLKLNEIVAAIQGASNRLIDVESMTESELRIVHEHYVRLSKLAKKDGDICQSHSIDEARSRHQEKLSQGK